MSTRFSFGAEFVETERTNTEVTFKYENLTVKIYKSWLHEFGGIVGEDSESLYFDLTPHLKLITVVEKTLVEEILPFNTLDKAKDFFNNLHPDQILILYTAILAFQTELPE